MQGPWTLGQLLSQAGGSSKAVKLTAGQDVPPMLPQDKQEGTAAVCRTLEISGRRYVEVRHPRWDCVLVGPRVGCKDPEGSHCEGRTGPTVEDSDVAHGGDHCIDTEKIVENTDFHPSVSDNCVDGITI